MLRDDVQATVNDLILQCADAQERYEEAAEAASQRELAVLFREMAEQRAGMCRELRALDRRLGDLPHARDPDRSTARSLLSRLKARLSADVDQTLIELCTETDARLADEMADALARADLPREVRQTVLRQQFDVTAALGRLAAVRARR